MPSNILYDVTVDDGKYRFVYFNDGKTPMTYRHGEPWDPRIKDMVGDKALLALVAEVSDLREKRPPLSKVIRLTERGVARVLKGEAGMLFIVERWGGVDNKTAMVLDLRYPDPGAVGGYQCWSIGEDGYEIVEGYEVEKPELSSENPRFSPIVGVITQVEVPMERVVNCIIGVIENGYSPWVHAFVHSDTPATVVALAESKDPAEPMIWYSRETFWRAGGQAHVVFDRETDDEGDGGGSMTVGYLDFVRGLSLMASKAPRHFADLVAENDDAVTHDVFMQMVVLGDIVYG